MRRASILLFLMAAVPAARAEPPADFTRRREFEAQYAYLDVPHGAPAQDWFMVSVRRSGSGWRVEAVGSNPKLAGVPLHHISMQRMSSCSPDSDHDQQHNEEPLVKAGHRHVCLCRTTSRSWTRLGGLSGFVPATTHRFF